MSIENTYVKDVYNKIAKPFDLTRGVLWNHITSFIKNIPDYSLIADIGCGNGKNMMLNKKCQFIGMDFTESFTNICSKKTALYSGILLDSCHIALLYAYTVQ